MKYEVQTQIMGEWANVWTNDAGDPSTFANIVDALQECADSVEGMQIEYEAQGLEFSPDPLRIRRLSDGKTADIEVMWGESFGTQEPYIIAAMRTDFDGELILYTN